MSAYRSIPRKVEPPKADKPVAKDEPVPSDLLKADLIALAETKGIDSTGTKAEILERLSR